MKTHSDRFGIPAILFIFLFISTACTTPDGKVMIRDLRCEYLINPMGIDIPQPRFSWIISGNRRGISQSAYRIIVTVKPGKKGKVWDSGKISSDKTIGIVYHGTPLESGEKYTWQVQVWDQEGNKASSQQGAWFQTGLFNKSDWKAKWITAADTSVPAPLMRNEFTIEKEVRYAWAFVTGLGQYEFYLNGEKVGDHVLDPGRTDFRKRILYATYDVTEQLKLGKNAAGIILGNGTYRVVEVDGRYGWSGHKPRTNTPRALMQLDIAYTDGSKSSIVTDGSWKSSPGPVTFNHVYGGEDYDARLEQPGWSAAGFDDSGWEGVALAEEPGAILKSQLMSPMKVMQTLEPVTQTHPDPGVWLFDLGQNFAGWWQIGVKGQAGVTVRVRGAETLNDSLFPKPLEPGDHLSTNHAYHARVWTDYTLKGDSMEMYEPGFFYTGLRYVEVTTDTPDQIESLDVDGRVVHTALEPSGEFESSDSLLNGIWRAAVWSQKGNLHSVPTDCPHREKGAYTGDGEIIAEASIHNFRMASFYSKWMNDMRDSQFDNGRIPNTAPTLIGGYGGGIAWGSAYILLPWWMYQYYTDTVVLADHYASMKRYLVYLRNLARTDANNEEPYIINAFGGYWDSLGEWCAPGQSDGPDHPVVNTAYYYLDALTLSKIAGVLGHKEDAGKYAALADTIKHEFNKKFFNPETKLYGTDSLYQTYQVLALALNIVPEEHREQVLQDLVDDIMITHHGHLSTGIIGTKYLWPVLAHAGRCDVAYAVATQTTYPGYGFWLSKGATTLWEKWEGTHSHNHQMFGTVEEFFYKYLAGIRSPTDGETTAGYKHIHIQPYIPDHLSFVRASVHTIRGKVESCWQRTSGHIRLQVVIPANCDASVSIPVYGLKNFTVTESEKPVWENNGYVEGVPGIAGVDTGKDHITFSIGSGKYDFVLSGEIQE
ncbi:MAG: family 78 glycoside hydrolase catalytic domain [Chlorobi bacterium]|nr:family 78 glycoside hydrolase catalytic domain [Chlorobiota bacterium]